MCVPAVSLGLGILQAGMQFIGQSQQASYENEANQRQYQANLQNLFYQERQGAQQEYFKGQEAEQKLRQEQMRTASGAATAVTAAGEAGVTGLSVNDLTNEYYRRQNDFSSNVKFNEAASVDEIQTQLEGLTKQTQGEDNQLASVSGPSPLNLLLGIGDAGVKSYNSYASGLNGTGTKPSASGYLDYVNPF